MITMASISNKSNAEMSRETITEGPESRVSVRNTIELEKNMRNISSEYENELRISEKFRIDQVSKNWKVYDMIRPEFRSVQLVEIALKQDVQAAKYITCSDACFEVISKIFERACNKEKGWNKNSWEFIRYLSLDCITHDLLEIAARIKSRDCDGDVIDYYNKPARTYVLNHEVLRY